MSYLSLSDKDKTDMLAAAGVGSIDELFCCIPEEVRLKRDLRLPEALTELELTRTIEGIGRKNAYPEPSLSSAAGPTSISSRPSSTL
jgi:glycine dehydrogenase subunit 1